MTTTKTLNVKNSSAKGWSNPCIAPQITKGKASIRLHHVMSPTCWWSWGYYGTLARIRLVYGNQVDINLVTAAVYTDYEHWLEHSGLSPTDYDAWAKKAQTQMGVPIATQYSQRRMPKDVSGPALAVIAALRQGRPLGERFERALLRKFVVEGVDVTPTAALEDAAREAGLDLARFRRDLADRDALLAEMEKANTDLPNVPFGFYNLAVEDERGRLVVLDYAFEPADVESAIEYLSGGKLQKNVPYDPVEYVRAAGPTPAREISRAFAWTAAATDAKLKQLAKSGTLKTIVLGGAEHWAVT